MKQRAKLLYLLKVLMENSDENHALSLGEIISELNKMGVVAERKALYRDIDSLREFGIDIIMFRKGRNAYYYVVSRDFELAELKLLVDLVQSSKFITKSKSQELIKKIESLTSKYEAAELQRQVYVSGRVKAENEKIYYSVDKIHHAINNDVKVSFQYFNWTAEKKKELRHNGQRYNVSPWALLWNNEKYYLVAFDDNSKEIRHFRVDKMIRMEILGERRDGLSVFKKCDMSTYTKRTFGMFDGEEKTIQIKAGNDLAGVIIDRFGTDVKISPCGKEAFIATVRVAVSEQFFGWVMSLGNNVEIVEPKDVRQEMKKLLDERTKIYK